MPEQKSSSSQYDVATKKVPTFYFIGVTTGHSSIMKLFPLWMEELDRPEVVIEGVDLKLHDDPAAYRQIVTQIKDDPLSLGGLVTSHKIDLFAAARDLFDDLDPYAKICGEVSCISKSDGALAGFAKDPVTAGDTLAALLGPDYFVRTGGEILCLGAGGAAVAIALHFIEQSPGNQPRRFVAVDLARPRLDHLKAMVDSQDTRIAFEYILNDNPRRNDDLMAVLPEGSLVINATGLGKDRPGSPITGAGLFPLNGIAWELNYRGERDFMHQALAQVESRSMTVEDGWRYFLHGWAQVIAEVLHQPIEGTLFERLAAVAEQVR